MDLDSILSGILGIGGGMTGNSGRPYDKAMQQYMAWGNQAQMPQQPYLQAGQGAIGNFQNWLQGQQNPGQFINNLIGGYQESPYAQQLQKQSLRAGQNAASASGLMGSTPLMESLQQNAGNIASQDLNQWLQNVLGINTQYGAGQQSLMQGGQQSANALTNLYNNIGERMGEASFGKQAGKQNDFNNILGGIGGLIGGLFL